MAINRNKIILMLGKKSEDIIKHPPNRQSKNELESWLWLRWPQNSKCDSKIKRTKVMTNLLLTLYDLCGEDPTHSDFSLFVLIRLGDKIPESSTSRWRDDRHKRIPYAGTRTWFRWIAQMLFALGHMNFTDGFLVAFRNKTCAPTHLCALEHRVFLSSWNTAIAIEIGGGSLGCCVISKREKAKSMRPNANAHTVLRTFNTLSEY